MAIGLSASVQAASTPAVPPQAGASSGIVSVPFRGSPNAHPAAEAADPVLPLLEEAMTEGVGFALRAKVIDSHFGVVDADNQAVRLARFAYDPDAENRLKEVGERVREAREEYFALDLAAARSKLTLASRRMEESPQMPEDLALVAEIKLLDGIIALAADPAGADVDFDQVLRLDPGRTLDPNQYPPYAVAALQAAKERFHSLAATQVNIESEPAGATIALDGIELGVTPHTLPHVPTGDHFYRLEKAHFHPLFGRMTFKEGGAVPIQHMQPARFSDLQQSLLAELDRHNGIPGAGLARLFAAERVLFCAVQPDGVRRYALSMWWADREGLASEVVTRKVSGVPKELAGAAEGLASDVLGLPASDKREPAVDVNAIARDLALLGAGTITAKLLPPPKIWYNRAGWRWAMGGAAFVLLLFAVAVESSQPGTVNYDVTVSH